MDGMMRIRLALNENPESSLAPGEEKNVKEEMWCAGKDYHAVKICYLVYRRIFNDTALNLIRFLLLILILILINLPWLFIIGPNRYCLELEVSFKVGLQAHVVY